MKPLAALVLMVACLVACADGDTSPTTVPGTPPPSPDTTDASPTTGTSQPPTSPTDPPPSESPSSTEATSTTATSLPALESLAYEEVGAVDFPTFLFARPGDEVAFLAERGGIVRRFEGGEIGGPVLDLSGRTTVDGERGLLGLARHPDQSERLFVHYTDGNGDTVVSEFAVGDDLVADDGSEQVHLTVDQPAGNHNGGMLQFGPDGALYLGLGDGGGAGDRFGHGQNQDTLLGGLVRIDVEGGGTDLWQYGLRNPWRFWVDGEEIWIADVGQGAYEEVNLADVTTSGLNYGWPITEGAHCFQGSGCDTSGLTMPIVEVTRGDGGACSITGGVVYRGSAIPELDGRFLFSDYCGGFLRSTDREGNVEDHTSDVGVAGSVISFGVDGAGEVYVLTVDRVLRLVPRR